jgi:hypothetical protein
LRCDKFNFGSCKKLDPAQPGPGLAVSRVIVASASAMRIVNYLTMLFVDRPGEALYQMISGSRHERRAVPARADPLRMVRRVQDSLGSLA